MRFQALCLTILILGSGCASAPVDVAIGVPEPPALETMSQDMRDRTDDDVVLWIDDVVGALKDYGVELRGRILIHDSRFEP